MTAKKPHVQLPPGTLQDINLQRQARELYETTWLAERQIAERLGMKSKTTIVRWRTRNGWQRPSDEVIARRVIAQGGEVETDLLPPPDQDTQDAAGPCPEDVRDINGLPDDAVSKTRQGHARDTSGDTPGAEPETPSQTRKQQFAAASDLVSVDALQESDEIERSYSVATPEELAAVHAKATRAQLRVAGRLAAGAHGILEQIETLMTSEEGDPRVPLALARLTRINPDRETLAGLAKSLTSMFESAVHLQRMALGMRNEVPHKQGDAPGAGTFNQSPDGAPTAGLALVLRRMDETMLLQMRQIARDVSTSRPQPAPTTIDGTAQSMPEETKT